MESYTLGSIIGRLLLSYIIVWFICFIIAKGQYKASVKKLHSYKGLLAIFFVFLIPLLVQIGQRLQT